MQPKLYNIYFSCGIIRVIPINYFGIFCHGSCGSAQVAAWLPKAATVNNLSSSALQAPYFVF
jgi:hypothetical protein